MMPAGYVGRARTGLLLVAVVVASVILSGCGPGVRMASIPPELIPEEYRNQIQAMGSHGHPITNVVWRVCEIKDGRLLVACTFSQELEPGVIMKEYEITSTAIDESGASLHSGDGAGGELKSGEAFGGSAGHGGSRSDTGEIAHYVSASGYCLDGSVKTIRGVTKEGKTGETTPSGGFWYLRIDGTTPNDRWESVSALNDKGKVVAVLPVEP